MCGWCAARTVALEIALGAGRAACAGQRTGSEIQRRGPGGKWVVGHIARGRRADAEIAGGSARGSISSAACAAIRWFRLCWNAFPGAEIVAVRPREVDPVPPEGDMSCEDNDADNDMDDER